MSASSKKHAILCVDDEADIVDALERLFRRKYQVFKATSGQEGLEILAKEPGIALIVSDQRMPNMEGVDFLAQSMTTHPEAIRILLTGYTDVEAIVGAINSGRVYQYINKPWDPVDLANTVDKAIERYDLSAELQEKNKALNAALEELKTLDEAKNHFMILINHELKTPLTVILSFLELLGETNLDDEQKKYLARIGSSSDKLKQIIEDVLELVSAETGVMKLSKKKISPQKLLTEVGKELAEKAASKSQKFVYEVNDQQVKADPKVLKSVMTRLLDNAIKFGDDGSEITISTQEIDGELVFSVTNAGKAIPEKTIEKILKPFSLDENVMNHSDGLGLGLSLTQALLRHHSSQLAIDCPDGQVRASFKIAEV